MQLGGEQVLADGRAGGGGLDPGAADCAARGGVAGYEGGGPSSSLITTVLYPGAKGGLAVFGFDFRVGLDTIPCPSLGRASRRILDNS